MDHPREIAKLFRRYLNNECSAEEAQLLLSHFNTAENEELLQGLIRAELQDISDTEPDTSIKLDNILKMIRNRMKKK